MAQEHAGQAYALAFALGQASAQLTHLGIEAVR